MALLNFVNAYSVKTEISPATKEQNAPTFLYSSLGPAYASDPLSGTTFSGPDVLVQLQIGNTSYWGWISRPIKSGGQIKGFYFWSDTDFTTRDLALAAGNTDADGNDSDNIAFLLVVDQAFFDAAYSANPTNPTVGTSSDRVDSALNSLVTVNTSPSAANDSAAVSEDGTVTGNVLTNDTDGENDPLSVISFSIAGSQGTLGSDFSISGVGTFRLNADGTFSFSPTTNYSGPVPTVTYVVSDGRLSSTAQLSITVSPVNDLPLSSDDTRAIFEDRAALLTLADFGSYSDVETTAIAAVQITSLPAAGSLSYFNGSSWISVSLNQTISSADINAGRLRFTPAANSTANDAVGFKVSDGSALSANAYTLTLSITAINDAPSGSDNTASIIEDTARALTVADFGFSDGPTARLLIYFHLW